MKGGFYRGRLIGTARKTKEAGFTIVEVLIVLAVSGLILLSAVYALNGKTNETEFTQAANDMVVQIRQVINDTANGYYPNSSDFSCIAPPPGISIKVIPGSNQQGTNAGCTFIGKVMQFQYNNVTANPEQYAIYPIVGLQCNPVGPVATVCSPPNGPLSTAAGSVIALAQDAAGYDTYNGTTYTTSPMENGLTTNSVTGYDGVNTYKGIGAVGFIADPSTLSLNSGGSSISAGGGSGSESTSLYVVQASQPGQDSTTLAGKIDSGGSTGLVQVQSVDICFASGTTSQSAKVTIAGGGGGEDAVSMNIYNDGTCT